MKTTITKDELQECFHVLINSPDFYKKARVCCDLVHIEDDKVIYELVQTSGLDIRGEVRLAAILALASRSDQEKTIKILKHWTDEFGSNSTTGGNPKWSTLLALSILDDYDMAKALDFEFSSKNTVLSEINASKYEDRTKTGVDRIAYLTTWLLALDNGEGDTQKVTYLKEIFPHFDDLLDKVLNWMGRQLG